ncbi:hypothetical protein POM88_000655 [Heracleum sosnowskyi]|uniref:WAT1-related protein n=1 Tax=Heracleum sosnowskyi TaxID=360622 RepID=A0AAD8JEP4_9APIA|nr:hypothetical protein POM88_000655 [Heracleum sosnowskyi]
MKDRGPVFVTAFNPLSMIIVAILGSFILAEKMYLGRVIGAFVIVAGLYLVVWGKSKDYKSETKTLSTDVQKAANSGQMIEASNNNHVENHKVITINQFTE